MKNLKETGKRLYSKNIIHIIMGIVILTLGYIAVVQNMDHRDKEKDEMNALRAQQKHLVFCYQAKLDSINVVNEGLIAEQDRINFKIDSISQKQHIINENHEKEINIIRDATLSEHAQWFSAKIDSIRYNYKPDN